MKPGDLILRKRLPASIAKRLWTALCALILNSIVLAFLTVLILSAVIAAADFCRVLAGNPRLFDSVGIFSRLTSFNQWEAVPEDKSYRREMRDLDAYRTEARRRRQLKDQMQDPQTP